MRAAGEKVECWTLRSLTLTRAERILCGCLGCRLQYRLYV